MKQKFCLAVLITLTGVLYAQQSLMSQHFHPDTFHYWKQRYLFTSEADWFMDPNDYDKLKMESFFAEAQKADLGGNQASGGFSTYAGSIYLGTFFDLNMGQGGDFGFVQNNELQLMLGTDFTGAFKLFIRKEHIVVDTTKFGLAWGMNFSKDSMIIKPEIMIGYLSKKQVTDGYRGYFNVGASVDFDFGSKNNHVSTLQTNYELRIGTDTDKNAAYSNHKGAVIYQRLYNMSTGLLAGWGLGANAIYNLLNPGTGETTEFDFNAESFLGFDYTFSGGIFGLAGQLFFNYPIERINPSGADKKTEIGGPQIRPVIGAVFKPHQYFGIEMRCTTPSGGNQGLGSVSSLQIDLMATLKK